MKFPRNARSFHGQLDAGPFLGVFFLLVLFLLLNSALVLPPGVKIEVPEAGEWPGVAGVSRLVVLDQNGRLYFDQQVIAPDALKSRLQSAVTQSQQPVTLVVQADKNVPLDAWMQLSALAREAGVREVLLASRPPAFAPDAP